MNKSKPGAKKRKTSRPDIWSTHAKTEPNENLVHYYKAQKIVPPEEWAAFMQCLHEQLPISFRISSIAGRHHQVLAMLRDAKTQFGLPVEVEVDPAEEAKIEAKYIVPTPAAKESEASAATPMVVQGGPKEMKTVFPATPLPWYPGDCGWMIPYSKRGLKRIPALATFRKWLMRVNQQGNINRQEAVSMLPPLLLDVESHHLVLDMCAAPGSKTAQLLEALHASPRKGAVPTGMVIANDADPRRAYMLVHQLKRYSSPCFLVTTHEGQFFPRLTLGKAGEGGQTLKFDRILCDVPCTGDGTLRKMPILWQRWRADMGTGMHNLQMIISCRAVQMLKVGGLMVYSTCSFNPSENEAAVAELLRRSRGGLELVDVSDRLPGLKRSPGLSTWQVIGKEKKLYNSFTELPEEGPDRKIPPSCFPPTDEEAKTMNLHHAFRVLPHHQNTGGFFVALLRKTKDCPMNRIRDKQGVLYPPRPAKAQAPDEPAPTEDPAATLPTPAATTPTATEAVTPAATADVDVAPAPTAEELKQQQEWAEKRKERELKKQAKELEKKKKMAWLGEHMLLSEKKKQQLRDFFGIEEKMTLMVRGEGAAQTKVHYVVDAIANLISHPDNSKLKVVATGMKVFEGRKSNDPTYACKYRVVNEGLHILLPIISKQVVRPPLAFFLRQLTVGNLLLAEIEPPELRAELQALGNGSAVLVLEPDLIPAKGDWEQPPHSFAIWKTDKSLANMIAKTDRDSLCHALGVEALPDPPKKKQASAASSSSSSSSSASALAAEPTPTPAK